MADGAPDEILQIVLGLYLLVNYIQAEIDYLDYVLINIINCGRM